MKLFKKIFSWFFSGFNNIKTETNFLPEQPPFGHNHSEKGFTAFTKEDYKKLDGK